MDLMTGGGMLLLVCGARRGALGHGDFVKLERGKGPRGAAVAEFLLRLGLDEQARVLDIGPKGAAAAGCAAAP